LEDAPQALTGPAELTSLPDGSLAVSLAADPAVVAALSASQQADVAAVRDAGTPLLASVEDGALRLQLEREAAA
jgi:hypothetical protein